MAGSGTPQSEASELQASPCEVQSESHRRVESDFRYQPSRRRRSAIRGGGFRGKSSARRHAAPSQRLQLHPRCFASNSIGWNNSLLTPKSIRLSPRVGLAWSANPKTVFRAGFGIYTNQAAYSVLQNLAENVPFFLIKTVANPTTPLYNTENILNANPTGAFGANGVNHNFAIEYNEVWNAALQRRVLPGTTVEAEYVGSRTVHADSSTAVNVPTTFGGARPIPSLSAFTTIRWDGWATFNSLTLKTTRRFAHGLSFSSGLDMVPRPR